jgi:phosphoglycolate phosphatase
VTNLINQNASLIFDLDGTLIDSAKDIQWVANKALSEIGATPISYEEAVSFIGDQSKARSMIFFWNNF